MIPMRRKDRQVSGRAELEEILSRCKVLRIGVLDAEGIYLVPVNFGYQWEDTGLSFYFHSAKEGRKVRAFAGSPQVGFELDCGHRLIPGETGCDYGFGFESIIGSGKIVLVTQQEERKKGLSLLMRHQTGREFSFTDQEAEMVLIYRLDAAEISGKRRDSF